MDSHVRTYRKMNELPAESRINDTFREIPTISRMEVDGLIIVERDDDELEGREWRSHIFNRLHLPNGKI